MTNVDQLNSEFGIANGLQFVAGNGGLPKAVITTPAAAAEVYLHGAHVTHYQPAGQSPVLFLSSKSQFAAGKAIRGGVPICFPWFGSLEGHPEAPAHGFARTSEWLVSRTQKGADGSVSIVMTLILMDGPESPWHGLTADYLVTVGSTLRTELTVNRLSSQPVTFEEALHSYFYVGDVRRILVTGLQGTHYLDKMQANRDVLEGSLPIHIVSETDRIYLDTTATCEIIDPALNRKITVKKTGSNSTVLWNPWIAKAKAMADFGDEEWPTMLCIETCNVGKSAVKLNPGASHVISAEVSVTSLTDG